MKEKKDWRDFFHTLFQIGATGCLWFLVASFVIMLIVGTYFPSNRQVAHEAVTADDFDRLQSVVSMVTIDATYTYGSRADRLTLLNVAVVESSPEIVALLLEKGWDPNHQGAYWGRSPLHRVVRSRRGPDRIEIINLLISNGADPNLQDYSGLTPLDYANFKEKDMGVLDVLRRSLDGIAE